MKRLKGLQVCALAIGAAMAAAPAWAHHSFAMFNRDKEVSVTGTVLEFQWTSPHAWIELETPGAKGATDKWGVELNSPSNLARQGWRSNLLRAGDKVTVVMNPLRSGEHGGLFLQVTLADGRVVSDRYIDRPSAANGAALVTASAQKQP